MITTQRELRKRFWQDHPHYAEQARAAGIISKPQNEHCATVRCAFVDWLDGMHRSGEISEVLADRATL
jgi:hypothetical protein